MRLQGGMLSLMLYFYLAVVTILRLSVNGKSTDIQLHCESFGMPSLRCPFVSHALCMKMKHPKRTLKEPLFTDRTRGVPFGTSFLALEPQGSTYHPVVLLGTLNEPLRLRVWGRMT